MSANPVHTLRCTECGQTLAYSIEPLTLPTPKATQLCYLCMHNLCDMGAILHATRIPTEQDLYIADSCTKGTWQICAKWRNAIIQVKEKWQKYEIPL